MTGYVKLHRRIRNHPLFADKPLARLMFIDMLMDAAWKDTVQDWRGKPITVRRGQVMMSQRRMADEYGFTHRQVRTILNQLANHEIVKIDTPVARGPTIVTICNYTKYQDQRHTGDTPNDTQATHRRHTKEEVEEVEEENPPTPQRGMDDPFGIRDPYFDDGIERLPDGSYTLVNGTRQQWLEKFNGDANALDLALVEANGIFQPNRAKTPLQQIQGTLGRIARETADRDRRYQKAADRKNGSNGKSREGMKPIARKDGTVRWVPA